MKTRRVSRLSATALAVVAACSISTAANGQGTGRSMDIDPSPRSSGMGGASNAVFWDHLTNHWGNPALLGYQRGLSYEYGTTNLVPELADDVTFKTNVIKLGGGGLGFAFSGKPFGVGGLDLSYGESEGTDPGGNPTGTFESYERIDAWSFGISAARAAETIAILTGHDPESWSRYGDVSFGLTGKHLEMSLAPGFDGETDASDLGVLVRLSPTEFFPGTRDVVGLDLSYGWSDLSFSSDPVVFPTFPPEDVSEHERRGYAGRIRFDWPDMATAMGGPTWLWEGLRPLVSFGMADDHAEIGTESSRYETDSNGWELTIANVFSLRGGHYQDLLGDIDGDTDGWGVGIPIGPFGGVRYDFAHFPQARNSDLGDLERHSASAWVDVMRIWRSTR